MLEKDKFQFKKSSLIKYTRQLNILIILEALISIQMTDSETEEDHNRQIALKIFFDVL